MRLVPSSAFPATLMFVMFRSYISFVPVYTGANLFVFN